MSEIKANGKTLYSIGKFSSRKVAEKEVKRLKGMHTKLKYRIKQTGPNRTLWNWTLFVSLGERKK